jgi:DNA-binding MarR family transcriptional regulator
MVDDLNINEVAAAIQTSIGIYVRQMRLRSVPADLTLPEYSALRRLSRDGSATTTSLARAEQITTQSMGATISSLESRGLVERHPDSEDGRKSILSLTTAGQLELRNRHDARTVQLSKALLSGFTESDLFQLKTAAVLIERLAYLI